MKGGSLLICFVALAIVGRVWGQVIEIGYNSTACGDNKCADSDSEGPICYEGKCRQCNPDGGSGADGDCLCGPSEYCVSDPNDEDFATCRSMESSILGRRCDPDIICNGPGPACGIRRDSNEYLFCGRVIFEPNGTVDIVEWIGFCNKGTCEQCSESERKCGSRGDTCRGGTWVHAPLTSADWNYLATTSINFNVFFIFLWLYVTFPIALCIYCCCFKGSGSGSSEGGVSVEMREPSS